MPRKFQIGDIVRATADGKRIACYGYHDDKLEVVSLCEGEHHDGEPMIQIRAPGSQFAGGRWREKWYELVEPLGGPW